jgi:hypothetical protein
MQRVGSRAQVMHGNAKQTGGGLKKRDLKYNKQGKIVSKKMSAMAKKEKRLQKAGYTTKKGQFGAVRTMKGGGKFFIDLYKMDDFTYSGSISKSVEFDSVSSIMQTSFHKEAKIIKRTEQIKKLLIKNGIYGQVVNIPTRDIPPTIVHKLNLSKETNRWFTIQYGKEEDRQYYIHLSDRNMILTNSLHSTDLSSVQSHMNPMGIRANGNLGGL